METTRSKFFIDTEFIESGPNRPIELLSIGIVAEDGRTFYAVDEGAVLANANAWVQENVLPHLGGPRLPRDEIRLAIKQFIGDCKPEFWGYYAGLRLGCLLPDFRRDDRSAEGLADVLP